MAPSVSLLRRKLDLAYFVYFCIHLPVMFFIDLTSLYPPSYVPKVSIALKEYLISSYQDQFFISPPPFFVFYVWLELFFHVPISLWSIYGLYNNDPRTPLVLLIYGMQTLVSTATCIAEYFSYEMISFNAKLKLTSIYGPYLAVALLMCVDMSLRINKALSRGSQTSSSRSSSEGMVTRSGKKKKL